jgi:phospholipid N-methyltransferase
VNIPRSIEPEWLDELAANDPRAIQSRRDLRRVNALMWNASFIARELQRHVPASRTKTLVEFGAGDGSLMLRLAKKTCAQYQEAHVMLLDQQDIVSSQTLAGFSSLGWRAESVVADIFTWLAQPVDQVYDVIIANLFLHHFDAERLALLLSLAAQRTRVFIACEPRRSNFALFGSRLLGVVGCNDVSRHDAVVSVRAGFDQQELSALWPENSGWALEEGAYGLFSHGFVASRVNDTPRGYESL